MSGDDLERADSLGLASSYQPVSSYSAPVNNLDSLAAKTEAAQDVAEARDGAGGHHHHHGHHAEHAAAPAPAAASTSYQVNVGCDVMYNCPCIYLCIHFYLALVLGENIDMSVILCVDLTARHSSTQTHRWVHVNPI